MHAKLLYFYPIAVKYLVLTGSWALIALDNTSSSTSLIFHTGTTWEKRARRSGWGVQRFRRVFPFLAVSLQLGGDRSSQLCQEHPAVPAASRDVALETSRALLGVFRNHPGCRAELSLGQCLVGSVLSTKAVLRLWELRTESFCVI